MSPIRHFEANFIVKYEDYRQHSFTYSCDILKSTFVSIDIEPGSLPAEVKMGDIDWEGKNISDIALESLAKIKQQIGDSFVYPDMDSARYFLTNYKITDLHD